MSSSNAVSIASNRGPLPQRFSIIQGRNGDVTYTEYGRPVPSTQFEADYFAYTQQNKASQAYGIRQQVTQARQAQSEGAGQPLPTLFQPFSSSTTPSQEYAALQSEQAYLRSNRPQTNNPYAIGEYNSLVQAYNLNVNSYQSTIANQNSYLQSLTGAPVSASKLYAGLTQGGFTISPEFSQFTATNPNAQVTVTRAPIDPFNPVYGGSKYQFTVQSAVIGQPSPVQTPLLTSAFDNVAKVAGYGGFFLSIPPREIYSLITTGKTVHIPLPSEQQLISGGTFALEAGGATAVGFAVGPIAAAVLPEGTGALGSIATRIGISGALGAGYGGATSYVSGQDVFRGAAIGALSFAGSAALFEGGSALVSRLSSSIKSAAINYVPSPSQNVEDPYSLNFLQRYINQRYILPNVQTSAGVSQFGTFEDIDNGARNFAAMVSNKLGKSPYAASGEEFAGQLKAGYESEQPIQDISSEGTPSIENVSSSGLKSIVRQQQVQSYQDIQVQKIESMSQDLDFYRQQSASEAASRINISRGRVRPLDEFFLYTPPGFQIPTAASSVSSVSLISLGSVQSIQSPSLSLQSMLNIDLGLQSIQSQALIQQQVQQQQQIQTQRFVLDSRFDLGLNSIYAEQFSFNLKEFTDFNFAVALPDIYSPRRKGRRSKQKGFFEFVRPHALSSNVLAEPSIARVGQLIFG